TTIEKNRTGRLKHAAALLVIDDRFWIELGIVAQLQHGQLIGPPVLFDGTLFTLHGSQGWRAAECLREAVRWLADPYDLAKESIHAPKVMLLPVGVERMAMALRTLNLVAEKYPGSAPCHRRHVELPFFALLLGRNRLAQVSQDKMDRRVLIAFAAGGE